MASQLNLDKGVNEMFCGSSDEMYYGNVRLQPVIFQDDILRLGDSLVSVRVGNVKLNDVMGQKKLKFNSDKTGFIMMGDVTAKNRSRLLIKRSPIKCGEFDVKEKLQDKYLGDVFHNDGLAASVRATVKDRQGKVKAAIMETAAIVEDCRSQCIGGFMAAIDLWELAIIPTLLYNAGTWTEIDDDTIEILEELQLFFLRMILQVPVSTPKASLRWETGLMSMRHRIEKEKIMLINHIKNSDDKTLAKQVYNEQVENGWPGLVEETSNICERLNISDINKTPFDKFELRDVVKKATKREDEQRMRAEMEGRTKTKDLVTESFSLKSYFKEKSLAMTREVFRIRTNMNELRGNFKHDKKYKNSGISCVACGTEEEVNTHVMVCKHYEDLRQGLDFSNNKDLVKFFKGVMSKREDILYKDK